MKLSRYCFSKTEICRFGQIMGPGMAASLLFLTRRDNLGLGSRSIRKEGGE
jgi:hypothetical protein